jgi:hypothetical protein
MNVVAGGNTNPIDAGDQEAAHAIRCFRQIKVKVLYMIRRHALVVITAIAFLFAPQGSASAQNALQSAAKPLPLLSPIFGDNMVLQRGKVNTIWGWSEPGAEIRVAIAGKHASAVAGVDRRWRVKIQPPPAGGPYTVEIRGPQTVELHNVLVGDVWLCGGQSNMQVGLGRARNGDEEVKAANNPEIRFFSVCSLRISPHGYPGRHLESCDARIRRTGLCGRTLFRS